MATTETFITRIAQKHDTKENWDKATTFVPKAGEICVYDADGTSLTEPKIKIGDGATTIVNLPFLNAYSLPTASASTLGGIKVGTNLSIDDDGNLSSKDTVYSLPTASASTLGGIKVGTNLTISSGVLSASDSKVSSVANHYTPSDSGASNYYSYISADTIGPGKSVNAITGIKTDSAGHIVGIDGERIKDTVYSLPTASNTTLGGIKVGTNLTISDGVLSAKDTTYSDATTSAHGLMTTAMVEKLNGIATGATKVTNNNQLTNGAGYITSSGSCAYAYGRPNELNTVNTTATWVPVMCDNASKQNVFQHREIPLDYNSSPSSLNFGDNTYVTYGAVKTGHNNGFLNLQADQQIQCRDYDDAIYVPIVASSYPGSSSRKYKENIETMTDDEARKILDVRPVTFDYVEGTVNENERYNRRGVIAEEVEDVIPQVVYYKHNEDGTNTPDSVDYSKFVPYLIKLAQMQQAEIEELKSKIGE